MPVVPHAWNNDGACRQVLHAQQLQGRFKPTLHKSGRDGWTESDDLQCWSDFNAVLQMLEDYDGPDPKALKAPAPDKFYTIHHVPAFMPNDFKVNDRNVVKINEDVNVGNEFDSRGVWYFEGNKGPDGLYLLDESLKLKSLHTQSSPYATGCTTESLTLSDESSVAVTIEKVGAANIRLKVNANYLSTNGDNIVAKADTVASNYIGTTFSHKGGVDIQANGAKYDNVAVPTTFAATQNGNNIDAFKTDGSITNSILCPNVNGNTAAPEFTFTLAYTGLPSGATYNNIALDIHAFNGSGQYHSDTDAKTDGKKREWTVAVQQKDGENYVDLGRLSDFEVVQGINRHKVWDVPLTENAVADAAGNLTIRLVVTKGSDNVGCFFGLSSVALSTAGEAHDQWYIEEVADPEKIYYIVPSLRSVTEPDGRAYASLYLGFNATVPEDIDAWIVTDVHDNNQLEMVNVKGIVPAQEGVILSSDSDKANQKFYYSATASTVDASRNMLLGTAYTKLVECGKTHNIYMLSGKNDRVAMYWTYENRNASGER